MIRFVCYERRERRRTLNYTWDDLFWIFIVYSFIGWCAGVTANALRRKRFINTGFLNLPICPVYGVIGVAYCIFLTELKEEVFFLFLGGAVVAFLLIVVTGVILEKVFNRKWWDYSQARFQFQGYLNFVHLLFFGAAAVLCIWFANPLLLDMVHMLPDKVEMALEICLEILVLTDVVFCVATVTQMHRSAAQAVFFDYVQNFTEDFGNALTRRVQKRMTKAYPNIQLGKILEVLKPKEKATVFAQGCSFYKLVWMFIIGAVGGVVVETIFCRFSMGEWMSRSSFVWGPFSIVWGFGCSFLTALLYRYRDRSDRYIFLYGTILGGFYEYACSVLSERIFGTVFWDYSEIPFNLGGRINLLYCFFWGIAAVVWIKILYPRFSRWIEKIPMKPGKIITWCAVVFLTVDMIMSALALYRYNDRLTHPEPDNALEAFLDQHFDDQRMEKVYPNAKVQAADGTWEKMNELK